MGLITPAVILQALLAPYYVPVLFGPGWSQIDEIVSILCLVAIPTTLWSATAGWLRATGRAHLEFWLTTLITSALMISTATFASFGLLPVAIAYALTASLLMVGASLPALSLAFGRNFAKV